MKRILVLILSLGVMTKAGAESDGDVNIPVRQVADMLYELAFANRKTYTRDVVQWLTLEESVLTAAERYHAVGKGLPLVFAQMFRLDADAELLHNTDAFWLSRGSLDRDRLCKRASQPCGRGGSTILLAESP